ncbi:MAG: DapH/DapD/GlmU-related protein [Promethearchaeota archaeon]
MKNYNKFIHSNAKVDEESFIAKNVIIGREVIIEEDVYICDNVKIYGKAIIKKGTFIGHDCIIGHPQREQLKDIIKEKKPLEEAENPLVEIHESCVIRAGTIIYSEVKIGAKCQTGHHVMIREKTEIGTNTLIGTNSVIDGNVKIGDNVSIQTGVYIPLHTRVGNNVFLGPYCKLTNDKYMMRKEYDLKGPIIEDFVSIGSNSVILPGLTIKKGTMVGAGSVVIKNTDDYDIIAGNPARFIKKVPKSWIK